MTASHASPPPAERDLSTGSGNADPQIRHSQRLTDPRTEAGRAALESLLADPRQALLATDFDGVLAPIVDDPDHAGAHPDAAPVLGRLARRLGAVAVVTGRPAAQAVRLGGFAGAEGLEGLRVLGQYGVERWDARTGRVEAPPPPPGVAAARQRVPALVDELGVEGVRYEDKGRALGVHLRLSPDPVAAMGRLEQPLADLAAGLGLHVEPGKHVLELRAPGSDKGHAIDGLLAETGATTVLYAGDDLGDAAAFEAVERHRAAGGHGLLLWSAAADPVDAVRRLAERADLVLDGPDGVMAWWGWLADQLETDHEEDDR